MSSTSEEGADAGWRLEIRICYCRSGYLYPPYENAGFTSVAKVLLSSTTFSCMLLGKQTKSMQSVLCLTYEQLQCIHAGLIRVTISMLMQDWLECVEVPLHLQLMSE